MKNKVLAFLVLVPLLAFSNVEGGVKEINYQAAYSYTKEKSDVISNSNYMSLSASVNIPIYKSIGSQIGAVGSNMSADSSNNIGVKGNAYNISGTIFAREKNIGKIGGEVGYSETNSYNTYSDATTTLDIHLSSTSYSYGIYGSYYLDDFTFSASLYTDNHNYDTLGIGATYYFKENTTLNISKLDTNSYNSFRVGLTHQPYFFDNTTEVGISYSNSNSKNRVSVSFFVSYYFGTKVSLKTRDREYR